MLWPITLFANDFSPWSEEIPNENENIIIESEVRYKWYKEIKVNEKYDLFDSAKSSNIDADDFIYTDEIESFEEPEELPYREISRIVYPVSFETDKASQILIDNFNYNDEVEISEISIYDKTTLKYVKYSLSENSILNGDKNRINDGFMSRDCLTVNNDTYLLLLLEKEYNINDLEIYIYISDNKNYNNTFDVSFVKNFKYKIQTRNFVINTPPTAIDCFVNHCKMTIFVDEFWILNSFFEEIKYIYIDKLFMYFKIHKEYLEGYHNYVEYYIKDESDYKLYYRFKTKEPDLKEEVEQQNPVSQSFNLENSKSKSKDFSEDLIKKPEKKVLKNIEKVAVVKAKEKLPIKNNGIVFVVIGLFLILILIISRIIFKKNKIRRTL